MQPPTHPTTDTAPDADMPPALRNPELLKLLAELYDSEPADRISLLRAAADLTTRIVERGQLSSLAAKSHLLGAALHAGVDETQARAVINQHVAGPRDYQPAAPPTATPNLDELEWWYRGVLWPEPSSGWQYLGGHLSAPEAVSSVTLRFDPAGIHATSPAGLALHIAWPDVRGLDVTGSDTVQSRVTVGRVLLVGVLALAWRKSENSAYLTVDTPSGMAVFARAEAVHATRARLAAVLAAAPAINDNGDGPSDAAAAADGAGRAPDVLDQIRRLGELAADGLLTAEEFAAAKAELLRRL